MKRTLLLICTLLCANVLLAQTFWVDSLQYQVTSTNPAEVKVEYANSSITTANIPATVSYNGTTYSVTSMGSAFYGCSSLTSVTIPNSVTSIGHWAFYSCDLTSVTIPNSVTSIGDNTFNSCSSLTSVTIGNSVTSIGDRAFRNCSSLTTLNFNAINCENFNSYSDSPFYNCPITTINIGDSVQRIPANFAYNLSSLTSISIPNSVTSIEYLAFANCSSLTSVTIPNSVTSIGNYAFEDCSSLTSVIIGNSVTSIGDRAFRNCSSLTSVTIPNSVTSIGESAFIYCDGLTSITIGNSVTSIGDWAFYGCSSLTSITCLAVTPPTFTSEAFAYSSSGINVIVPCSALDNYINSRWNNRFPIIGEDEYNVVANVNNDDMGSVAIENNCSTATLTATATACYQFVGWNDGNTENPRIVTLSSDTTLTANFGVIVNDITATICEGQVYNENGFNVNEAGVYTQSLQTINGCDSVVTLTLNVNPVFNTPLTATICEGSVYNENGFNVSEAGTYTQSLQSVNGCDSIVTLTLNVNPVINTSLTATICEGSAYTENGFNVSEAGVYTLNLQTDNGCDSIVTLNLSVSPIYNTDLVASICEGEVYNENGFNVNEAGVYSRTLQAVNGCDSIVTLTLSVNPIFNTNLSAFICEGETYSENGFNVSEAGTYTQSLQSVLGCDSIVTLTLNVNPVFNTPLTATICEGSVYNENGFNVSEAGTYTQSLQSVNGCDSIVTLTLNVNPVFNTSLTATICEGSAYTENGFNVSEAGIYTQTLQTINGCDSVVTLNLNVNPVYNTDLFASICEGEVYNENGFNVNEAGVYSQTLQAVNGCDSVVNLTLSVNPIFNTNLSAFICEGETYSENGFNVSEAGTYTQSLQSVLGCDSIVTLTLNVNPVYNTPITATICEGSVYNENGFNVSEAGVYTQTLQTINGCDSIVTLTLTVLPSYNINLTATICQGSELNISGFNVSEAGVYTQNLTSVNGCDSIVTLTVTELPIIHTDLTLTICEGTSLNFSGFNVSEAGVYTQTHTSVNGCDSIVTLTVTELPTVHTNLTLTICEGTSLNFSGFNVSEAGVYTQTHTSVNGCDSIVTLTVSVNPTFDTTINATINPGETYAEFGFNESEAGTYVQNLQTEFGCDSTITLVLSVNSSLLEAEIEEISFYPNPTDSKVNFSQAIEKVEVIDLTGKTILTFSNAKTINIESLPSGAYYLRLTNNDKAIMQKVIKQ